MSGQDNGGQVHPFGVNDYGTVITLRDYFAIRILCASLTEDYDIHTVRGRDYYSKNAYLMADRMIKRSKEVLAIATVPEEECRPHGGFR